MTEVLQMEDKSGADFATLNQCVRDTFATRMGAFGPHLFSTKSAGLSSIYVLAFPAEEQQHHNCNCCRDFIRRFGNSVFVQADGTTISALWDHTVAPAEYAGAIRAMETRVEQQEVVGQFFTSFNEWGTPETNGWSHFHVQPSLGCTSLVPEHMVGTVSGAVIEAATLLGKAIEEFPIEVVAAAVNLLSSDRLNRAESFKEQAVWLHSVIKRLSIQKNLKKRSNALFLEAVNAPSPSWNRIANTVVGKLMEDIKADLHVDSIVGRFNSLTSGEVYQRSVAPPSEGNIKVAQKLFEELGLSETDLERRAAYLEEVRCFWTPAVAKAAEPSKLFGNLATKEQAAKPALSDKVAPSTRTTYARFAETILPTVLAMKIAIPGGGDLPFTGFVAPVHADAKPIFYYDTVEDRNPISWYIHEKGSPARHFALDSGSWVEVTGLSVLPPQWTAGDQGRSSPYIGVVALLKGAVDRVEVSACLFEELLDSKLREAKRVVAAYSNTNTLKSTTLGTAAGIALGAQPLTVRVTTEFGLADYVIDRLR